MVSVRVGPGGARRVLRGRGAAVRAVARRGRRAGAAAGRAAAGRRRAAVRAPQRAARAHRHLHQVNHPFLRYCGPSL